MRSVFCFLAAALVLASPPAARAFPVFGLPPPEITVYEYYNVNVNRYVLLNDPQEIAFVESGGAGAGWQRTQYAFQAYPAVYNAPGFVASPVYRFYAPSVNSHFYTALTDEYQLLLNPELGWIFERVDFSTLVPEANGTCDSPLLPVWRLYNNRFQYGDTDHRYTPDATVRDSLVAQGWIDEGVNFCVTSYATPTTEIVKQAFHVDAFTMRTNGQCLDPSVSTGSCLDLFNVAPLPNFISKFIPPQYSMPNPQYNAQFEALTGYDLMGGLFTSESPNDTSAILADSYVQNPGPNTDGSGGNGDPSGIHVVAAKRTAGTTAAINSAYTLPTSGTGQVLPFADGQPHTVFLSIGTRPVTLRASAGTAQGGPAIRFVDQKSGGAIEVFVQAYGTAPAAADSVTFDATSKVVQATTSFKESPLVGHVYVGSYIQCNGAPCTTADAGFAYGLDQTTFAQLVTSARALNPALSPDIRDYMIANFRFVNQASLDGEIGVKLWNLEMLIYGLWYNN